MEIHNLYFEKKRNGTNFFYAYEFFLRLSLHRRARARALQAGAIEEEVNFKTHLSLVAYELPCVLYRHFMGPLSVGLIKSQKCNVQLNSATPSNSVKCSNNRKTRKN